MYTKCKSWLNRINHKQQIGMVSDINKKLEINKPQKFDSL